VNGEARRATAGKVIVSCGFNGTPRLLYRSGYGPREKVEKVKAELIAENRNVGANLVSSVSAQHIDAMFDEPIVHPDIGVHTVYFVERVGKAGYNHLLVAENLGFREGSNSFPTDLALNEFAPPFGREFKVYMKTALMHVGNIRIELSKNPLRGEIDVEGRPVFEGSAKSVTREYLAKKHPEIIEFLQEGHELGKKIVQSMGPRKVSGMDGIGERYSTNHQHGTCRAGASSENSVVNSDLESHDVDNLLICDAVPFQGTANPSMPTAAVCNYAWRRIVGKYFTRA
jgi:choline dehydrogenase-like flavoprotein